MRNLALLATLAAIALCSCATTPEPGSIPFVKRSEISSKKLLKDYYDLDHRIRADLLIKDRRLISQVERYHAASPLYNHPMPYVNIPTGKPYCWIRRVEGRLIHYEFHLEHIEGPTIGYTFDRDSGKWLGRWLLREPRLSRKSKNLADGGIITSLVDESGWEWWTEEPRAE